MIVCIRRRLIWEQAYTVYASEDNSKSKGIYMYSMIRSGMYM